VSVDDRLFKGLGCVKSEYSITLRPDAKPFAIHVPRPIPFPRRKMADEALKQMLEDGVIKKVEEPTPWVAPMVVVPKSDQNKVRICTDYTELNKHVVVGFGRYPCLKNQANSPRSLLTPADIGTSGYHRVYAVLRRYSRQRLIEYWKG